MEQFIGYKQVPFKANVSVFMPCCNSLLVILRLWQVIDRGPWITDNATQYDTLENMSLAV